MKSNVQIMQVDNGWVVRSHATDERGEYAATSVFQDHQKQQCVAEVMADVIRELEAHGMVNVEISITPIDKMVFGNE